MVSWYCSAPGETLANIKHLPVEGSQESGTYRGEMLLRRALASETRLQEVGKLRIAKRNVILNASVCQRELRAINT